MKTLKIFLLVSAIILAGCSDHASESDLYNVDALTPAKFDPVKMNLKPMTEFINPNQNTMGVIYANKAAFDAKLAKQAGLQPGESFVRVTWKQKTDQHWFGANIPSEFVSMEVVKTSLADKNVVSTYQKFDGKSLAENADTAGNAANKNYILAQRPVVMP